MGHLVAELAPRGASRGPRNVRSTGRDRVQNKGANSMFRKILFTGVAAVAFLIPFTVPSSAQAHDGVYVYHGHYSHYAVVYRSYPFGQWRVYGVFHSPRTAHEAAENLRFRGINARVVYR
jgi:hypothetical protein